MQSIIEDFGGISAGLKKIEEAKQARLKPSAEEPATSVYYGHEWVDGQYVPCARPVYEDDFYGFMG